MVVTRAQWKAVWRLIRLEKRALKEAFEAQEAKLRERSGIADGYEFRMASYTWLVKRPGGR